MKITYIKLVNFKNILSALNRRMIEIDFSKAKHRIIIFLGDNGTGKSSILRELHPFPNSGNTDNRNIKELIMEDCEGFKELHIKDDNDVIKIKHIYSKSGSVKSYYNKNGQELNPNGNVTSFLEVLYFELGLTKDFLSLLRLGANDSNFIKMSATERKKFTVSLLDDTVIYGKLFRYISEDLRVTKATLKSVADKLNRMKIYSEEEIEEELEKVLKSLMDSEANYTRSIEEKAVLNANINQLLKSSTVREKQDELMSLKTKRERILKDLDKIDTNVTVEYLQREISNTENALSENEKNLEIVDSKLTEANNQLVELQNMIERFNNQLANFNIEEESRLEELIKTYEKKIESLYDDYKDLDIPYSSEDMKEALDLMKAIDNVSNLMLGFNSEAKKELVQLYLEEPTKNHESYIASKLVKAEQRLEKAKTSKVTQAHRTKVEYSETRLMFKPAGCQYNNCSMEAFYRSITQQEEFDFKEIDRTIAKLEKELKNIEDYYAINSNIHYIKMILESNRRLIEKIPSDLINFNKILVSLAVDEVFYDEEHVTKLIAISDNKKTYDDLVSRVEDAKKELSYYKENSKATKVIRDELEGTIIKKDKLLKEFSKNHSDKTMIVNSINELKGILIRLNEKLQLSLHKEELNAEVEESKEKIKVLAQSLLDIDTMMKGIHALDHSIKEASYYIRTNQDKAEILRRNKSLYREYREEQAELEEKFQDQNDIRDALSSSEGIPLIYMKVYMMDSTDHINNLLNIAYGGALEVSDIIVDENVFKIPYVKNGISIPDVKSCSQGEETFLSMAISFAFIYRSIEKYNILLFDEIDAALDPRRRQEFLNILNEELDLIQAQQAFFITHNNAFYDHPVDVVMTSPVSLENYKNVNIIFDATKE